MPTKENIILGIDPGTNVMGYGLIKCARSSIELLQFGVIHLGKYANHEIRLKKIFDRVVEIIGEYYPDEVALEAPFYGKNIQSMLKLGRAQGVAMAAALSRDLPITEYAPKRVKQSVTGNGNASKQQVAAMLQQLLHFDKSPMHDATDALAVAICHHFSSKVANSVSGSSWKAFLNNNPSRIK